ncbi:MAG: hypothetical protein HQL63_03990 [Magnetococcales bacterium]|nr:hypothetical protein [Magnetococcales bacterium]
MSIDDLNLLRQKKRTYGSAYEQHLFEQYKLCVEMADRVSARRVMANSFFLAVHTALIAAFAVLLKEKLLQPTWVGMLPFAAVMLLCLTWWFMVHSYRQLNTGKFKVIHTLEQMLPVAPYDAEWVALGGGKNPRLYWPLTHVENGVPILFVVLYLLLGMAVLRG